jgi:8-oxo-dGTP diphosphatase
MDWVGLRDLQLGVAFRAGQDFAFLDFIFIQVDFGVALGTSGHVGSLLPGRFYDGGAYYITPVSNFPPPDKANVRDSREYPQRPIVGVGGVVISHGRALLIKRGHPPLEGEWSIPGGTLEVGETLLEGVRRELAEECGIEVRVLDLIEVFERVFRDEAGKVRYHFVILDYLCEAISGEPRAGSDVVDVAWATETELERYSLTPTATRVIRRAFEMARARGAF